MQDLILPLTQKLISIPSNPDNPGALSNALETALTPLAHLTIEFFEKNGTRSALVYAAKKRPEKFRIILNAHLDVIPGKQNQYTPRIEGDRLYGVGAMDMKGNAASMIAAFAQIAPHLAYPIALQLVTDEEVGGFNGTKHQIDSGVRADFVLAGEPTNFDIVHKAKGILQIEITAPGKTGHGAYPWRGSNAVWRMHEFLSVLKKEFPVPTGEVWATTLNLSTIKTTNESFNKIPDDCTVRIDIRFVDGNDDRVLATLKKILPPNFNFTIKAHEPAMNTPPTNDTLLRLQNSAKKTLVREITLRGANGSSDARHFAIVGGAGIEFGPEGGDIGGDNEWVSISGLNAYYATLIDFLENISS